MPATRKRRREEEPLLGAHVSTVGGVACAIDRACAIGCTARVGPASQTRLFPVPGKKAYRPLPPQLSWRKTMKERTPDELERAIEHIGYAVLQGFVAHQIFHDSIVPALRKNGIHEDLIHAQNNASLESQLLFLRKLNEFFKSVSIGKLKEDDLRAEHYSGFESMGTFLSDLDEDEIHKRVGHITLIEVRHGKKNWAELVKGCLPIAVDRLLQFFLFLRDSYPSLSTATREDVEFLHRET
jgi:hypothetical protein